jgi:DNA polymerase/3'-5' exonuclease PolX
VWPKHVAPLIKPLLTPYYRKVSCDLTVINKAYIGTALPFYTMIKKEPKKYEITLNYQQRKCLQTVNHHF